MPDLSLVPPSSEEQPVSGEMVARMAEIRTASTLLLDRMRWAQRYGLTFKGMRDLNCVLGYDDIIFPTKYRQRYARGGVAGRIVDAFPKATWRGGGMLVEDEDPKVSTTFEKVWEDLEKRLKIWSTFLRADILAGLGRYSVILLGVKDPNLTAELPKGKPDDLLYLTPFSEEDAIITEWETDGGNERFGLPRYYQLQRLTSNSPNIIAGRGTPAFSSDLLNRPVHWSRVIHIAENTLDDEVFGQPTLERVWNLLDDLDKVTGGGAEAFWLRANQGIQLNVDKDMTLGEEEKKNLALQADEYQHQIRRFLRTRGVDVNTLGSDVANFANPADAILTQIAGAKAIPKRILTGSEMGELASSQDRENWRDQVTGRQSGYAEPYIVRPFADRLITYGYLPKPKGGPTDYEVDWPHTQVLTEQEKSAGVQQWATTNNTQGKPVFTVDEMRDHWYGFEPLTPEQIKAETPEPPPQLQPGMPGMPPGAGFPRKIEEPKPNTDPAEADATPPPNTAPKKGQPPALARAAEAEDDEALIVILEDAILNNQPDVVDRMLGLKRPTNTISATPNIVVNVPKVDVVEVVREMQRYYQANVK